MGAIIFFLLILTFIGLLLLPCLITLFWQSRPIVAFVTALILALIISILPGIIQTFQAMMIYGEGDPELVAGALASAFTAGLIGLFFYVPFLLLSQWLGRIRKRKRDLATLKKDTFE